MNHNQHRSKVKEILGNSLQDRYCSIVEHTDPNLIGKSGIIIEETNNMIHLQLETKVMWIAKAGGTFKFDLEELSVTIAGRLLLGPLKKRQKRRLKAW